MESPDYSKLTTLYELKDNWDNDGAPAPSKEVLNRTRAFLDRLKSQPDDIDADALGGVALWLYSGERKIMIGFYNEDNRSVLCYYKNKGAIPKVDVFTSDDDLFMYINCISMLK